MTPQAIVSTLRKEYAQSGNISTPQDIPALLWNLNNSPENYLSKISYQDFKIIVQDLITNTNTPINPKKKEQTQVKPKREQTHSLKSLKTLMLENTPSKSNEELGIKYQCHYCTLFFPKKKITIDHKHPKSKGGKNTVDNVVSSCFKCNNLKGNIPYEEFIKLYPPYKINH